MNLSQVKMVVTDMDGTLLNSNHEVSSRFFALFAELKKHNILFAAASGRQYRSIIDKLSPIKDDILVIAENGGYVMHQEKELLSTPLSKEKRLQILQTLNRIPNINIVLCGKNHAYITNNDPEFATFLKQFYSEYIFANSLEDVEAAILKIAVYHAESSEHYTYPQVKHLEDTFKVKISGPNWIDISTTNANKGYALQKMQERFGISPEETMVFGDYNNDLEMLSRAKYSYAMANAHQNVLNIANFKTTSNDDFGVERVLESLVQHKQV